MSVNCKKCNAIIPDGNNFCLQCGASVSLDSEGTPDSRTKQNIKQKCSICGTEIPNGSNFCISCGNSTGEQQTIKLENNKKKDFDSIVDRIEKATDETSYKKIAEKLKDFIGFENADELYKLCLEQAEICRKNKVYSDAIELFKKKETLKNARNSIEMFQSIVDWKDSKEQIEIIKGKLDVLIEEDKQKRKKVMFISIIVGIILLVGAGAAFGIKTFLDIKNLSNEFDLKVEELNTIKETVNSNIQNAEKVYAANEGSKKTLDSLNSAINEAKNLPEITIPQKEKWPSSIRKQIDDLQNQIDNYQEKNSKLTESIDAVTKSAEEQKELQTATTGTVSQVVKNSNGYSFKVTWTLGKWIKASDKTSIEKAWKVLGGTGDTPYIEKFGNSSGYTEDKAMILIGKCYIENITDGYSISSNSDETANANVNVKYLKSSTYSSNYESSSSFKMLAEINFEQKFVNGRISAELNSNTWGPVTFAIAVPNVFMPNNEIPPSGYYLRFDENTKADIALSW